MRSFKPLVLLLCALSAEAGIFYKGPGYRVWIDGDRRRIEHDPTENPRAYDISITANGKTTYINRQNKTYYYADEVSTGISSRLFRMPWPVDSIKGQPKFTYRNDGAGPSIGDYATTRHVIEFRYRSVARMHDVPVTGDVDATWTVMTVDALPRFDVTPPVITGLTEIDDALKKHFASIEGLMIGSELTVNRKLEGGPVQTEHQSRSATELKKIDVDPKLFEIPAGFTHQKPVYGFPGD